MLKAAIKNTIDKFGYQLSRKPDIESHFSEPFHLSLLTLLGTRDFLRIVQIGANDGSVDDPLYRFVCEFADRTSLLLIEPQSIIIPYLKQNYTFHNRHKIFNGAIGPAGHLTLYSINAKFWDCLHVPYAKGWPQYAAPCGVTSTSRDHVVGWLLRHLDNQKHVDEAIVEIVIQSSPLQPLLAQMECEPQIDILQVDVEGFDDQAIYNCSIEETKPIIINFERKNLSPARFDQLSAYLGNLGYLFLHNHHDTLAIMTRHIR